MSAEGVCPPKSARRARRIGAVPSNAAGFPHTTLSPGVHRYPRTCASCSGSGKQKITARPCPLVAAMLQAWEEDHHRYKFYLVYLLVSADLHFLVR